MQVSPEGSAVDLLGEQLEVGKGGSSGAEDVSEGTSGHADDIPIGGDGSSEHETVVRLLQAVRIPSHHARMVRARVEGPIQEVTRVFEPAADLLSETTLTKEEGIVEEGRDRTVTLNQGNVIMRLPLERILGQLLDAKVLPEGGEFGVLGGEGGHEFNVSHVTPQTKTGEERVRTLWEALQLQESWLSPAELTRLKQLIAEYADIFALDSSELGYTEAAYHSIDTGDHPPIRQMARRAPFTLRKKIDDMVDETLERGVIQPSKSSWASPVVLVAKKDGSTRFCIDYRKLNAVTKLDVFLLPSIDDSLDSIANAKYFTTLDLAPGYWQVPLDAQSREKTAFTTHSGLFEFCVMPFGLCNASATFQRLMEMVLAGLARDSCMVYLDNILVIGKSFTEHFQNLEQVFDHLREAGLSLKPKKCHLAVNSVEYLGYVVTDEGISADQKKIAAIRDFPTPRDLKALRSFVGLASYYRRFIPSFSKIASPLFPLTKEDVPFEWSSSCQNAFESLKEIMAKGARAGLPLVRRRVCSIDRCVWNRTWGSPCPRTGRWICPPYCLCKLHSTTARA